MLLNMWNHSSANWAEWFKPKSPLRPKSNATLFFSPNQIFSFGSGLLLDFLTRVLMPFTKYFQCLFWTQDEIEFLWPFWSLKQSYDLVGPPNKSRSYLCHFWVETFRASERFIMSSFSCLTNCRKWRGYATGVLKQAHHPAEYLH